MRFFTFLIKRKNVVATLMACIFFSFTALAQEKPVSGKIIDALNSDTMIGATLNVIGTTNAVAADVHGSFKINVQANQKLQIKSTGYQTLIITPGSSKPIVVKLYTNSNETVVVGKIFYRKKLSLSNTPTTNCA